MKRNKVICFIFGVILFIFAVGAFQQVIYAMNVRENTDLQENYTDVYDFTQIDIAAKRAGYQGDFKSLVQMFLHNNDKGLFANLGNQVVTTIAQTCQSYRTMILQIVVMILFSAFLALFTPEINHKQVSELAQMTIGLSLTGVVLVVFIQETRQCVQILEQVKAVYLAVLPVFFSAVLVMTGEVSVAVYQEIIALCLQVVTIVFEKGFIRMNQAGLLLTMADSISDKPHFTKASKTLFWLIRYGCKAAFLVFSGLTGIKGMGAPLAEAVRKNVFFKALQAIPVIGDSAESITQVVTGGSAIARNGIGIAAISLMIITTVVPFMKMIVTAGIFRILAILAEPLTDKKVVNVLTTASTAIGLLAQIILTTVLLFMMFIVLICKMT